MLNYNQIKWLVIALVFFGIWYFTSPVFWKSRAIMPSAMGQGLTCAMLPPVVRSGDEPLQTELSPAMSAPIRVTGATLTPLAGFSMEARVLSREDYRHDEFAKLSSVDLFVGWGIMAKDEIVKEYTFRQRARFGGIDNWETTKSPLSYDEVYLNASNMHLIPSNMSVAKDIARIRVNQTVRLDGWLVSYRLDNGWHGSSSMSRADHGAGACEIILVCSVHIQ